MRNTLLRAERLRHGWTQQQLADFAGISLSTVERAEKGESIRVDCIQRLCECLSKTSEELGLLKIDERALESDTGMKQRSAFFKPWGQYARTDTDGKMKGDTEADRKSKEG